MSNEKRVPTPEQLREASRHAEQDMLLDTAADLMRRTADALEAQDDRASSWRRILLNKWRAVVATNANHHGKKIVGNAFSAALVPT